MKRIATTLTALLLMAGTATAQDYGQARTLKIWDNKTAPHGNGIATPEREPEKNRLTDVSEAVLYIFPAAPEKATGQAVVICPGGGYVKLCIDYEGYEMAQWFAEHGITAAVLKYRMPNGHPEVPLEDVEQALRIMMGLEAGATGFTADKVGIVGSSAGGHLAASASTLARTKPAFSILFYPVITAEKGKAHQGSFNALLGDQAQCGDRHMVLAPEPREQRNPAHPAAAFGRRPRRPARKQHALLQRAEGQRRQGLYAHLPDGRPRLGHPQEFQIQGAVAADRARLATGNRQIAAARPAKRVFRHADALSPFFRMAHCRFPIIAYLCAQNEHLWQTTPF